MLVSPPLGNRVQSINQSLSLSHTDTHTHTHTHTHMHTHVQYTLIVHWHVKQLHAARYSIHKHRENVYTVWYISAASDVMPRLSLKPFLNWANVLRTVRRTMIRFLIELLVRRTWFGQFDEFYFVLNWLVMRCKLRPELADAQQTAWSRM